MLQILFLKFKKQDLALIQCSINKELSYILNFVVFEVVGWKLNMANVVYNLRGCRGQNATKSIGSCAVLSSPREGV